ncbi:fungal-specific transcription factor domain-containing protein [Daldinia caldariorum]|uniref:fungal-specific transcription factor domain-containing protein n=1 Tax=Daldinia caldariorum TaxID=326644 RepID=UPI0020073920|nr:fungal-specific transcription factor domain-containing protein [Daldinia caldariorum]KAI1471020.1 fungal-specific transcription factor domain-containing protein [Daldinia caldariorum]
MLLYTRVAPPKVPKRRSRAGCTFWYVMSDSQSLNVPINETANFSKKKCDEKRPRCARCIEKDLQCTYEAVRPRQRRKKDPSHSGFTQDYGRASESTLDHDHWREDTIDRFSEADCLSPIDAKFKDMSPMSLSENELFPVGTSPTVYEYDGADDGDQVQEIIRRNSSINVVSQARSFQPDLAMIAPCPVGSPTLEFVLPVFSEFSDRPNRRALVDHFCNVLSHLIVFREESGNPFQQLVLPLSHRSAPIMNAVYALASAHLEYRGIATSEKSLYFHNRAIQGLARLIEQEGKVDKTELLAAIMLLVYYEVLVQRGRTNIVDGHLKGALTIMSSSSGESTPAGLFLERAFRFYDVITALSLGSAPLSTAPAAGCLIPFPPPNAPAVSPLSNVDSLLGMATTLWPIMHRLSNLLSLKNDIENACLTNQTSKSAVLRMEFETTSQAIETALAQWEPCLPPHFVVENDVLRGSGDREEIPEQQRLQSTFHNSLAYRHSAFVYLYRTIYKYSPRREVVQKHAHIALIHCVGTVTHGGPMGALLWPLFVAACEAITAEDRALAQKAFFGIDQRQGMTNIGQAWNIVQEVWKRLDDMKDDPSSVEDSDLWRKISAEMGVSIVFG